MYNTIVLDKRRQNNYTKTPGEEIEESWHQRNVTVDAVRPRNDERKISCIHHILPRCLQIKNSNDISNLVCLCRSHHDLLRLSQKILMSNILWLAGTSLFSSPEDVENRTIKEI